MTENDFSFSKRIGKTNFIVNVKQSESAKRLRSKAKSLPPLMWTVSVHMLRKENFRLLKTV